MIISVSLRRIYPGGVLARDFDATGLSKKEKTSPGSCNKGSALVYPVCQVDGDLEARGEGGPPEGCEMVGRAGRYRADEEDAQPTGGEREKPRSQNQQEPQPGKEEKEGCCVMCLDECDAC